MWELEAERYDPKPQNFDVQIERQETYLPKSRGINTSCSEMTKHFF